MLKEIKIRFEVDAWISRKWVISDAVALELFSQYRGSSDYPFDGVSAAGIVDDAQGLLNDIEDVTSALQTASVAGDGTRYRELSALKGWVHNWVANHTGMTGFDLDRVNEFLERGPR
jgi:hypothetical protein